MDLPKAGETWRVRIHPFLYRLKIIAINAESVWFEFENSKFSLNEVIFVERV